MPATHPEFALFAAECRWRGRRRPGTPWPCRGAVPAPIPFIAS